MFYQPVSFHVNEWPFSGGAFFMSMFVTFFFFPQRTSIRTIALIQGGFFSAVRETGSRLDNRAKSVTKTCNHIIDSVLEYLFLSDHRIVWSVAAMTSQPLSGILLVS